MNGIEFLRVAKQEEDLKRIPVVVLTASSEERDRPVLDAQRVATGGVGDAETSQGAVC